MRRFGTSDLATAIRGLAAIAVCAIHSNGFGLRPLDSTKLNVIGKSIDLFGTGGPAAFFIVSAYAISHSLEKNKTKYINFVIQRIFRLTPLYLLSMIAMTKAINWKIVGTSLFQPVLSRNLNWDILGVGWSLPVEFYCSISIPLISLLLLKLTDIVSKKYVTSAVIFVIFALVTSLPFLYSAVGFTDNNLTAYKSVLSGFSYFVIGIIIYKTEVPFLNLDPKIQNSLTILSLAVTSFIFTKYLMNPSESSVPILGFVITIFILHWTKVRESQDYKIHGIFIFLGTVCYGIYLINPIVAHYLPNLVSNDQVANSLLQFAITVFFATLSWLFIELPMIKLGKKLSFTFLNSSQDGRGRKRQVDK